MGHTSRVSTTRLRLSVFLVLNSEYHYGTIHSGYVVGFNKRSELNAHELANEAGVNYHSLITLLRRWQRWHYVEARKQGRVNYWTLTAHGHEWLDKWWPTMPDYTKEIPLFNEIAEHNAEYKKRNFRGYTI